MALPKTLTNFTAFVDGVGYVGRVMEGTPPVLALKTEEYMGGGMAGVVELNMGRLEKMEATLKFGEYDPALLGLIGRDDVAMSLRGSQGPDNEAVIWEMRGLLTEVDPGNFEIGKNALTIKMVPNYLRVSINGTEAVEADAANFVFRSGGTDHLAGMRTALGL